MAGVAQEIDLQSFGNFTNELAANYNGMTFTEVWPAVSFVVSNDFKRNFDQSSDPEGNPWQPLKQLRTRNRRAGAKAKRQGRKTGSQKPLRDTDHLMASTGATGTPDILRTSPYTLEQGTNVEYAAVHQYGYKPKNIPERPFVGIGERLRAKIEDVLGIFAEKKVAGK